MNGHLVRHSRMLVLVVFSVLGLSSPTQTEARQARSTEDADSVLEGTIDIHVHSDPDRMPRAMDGIEVAKLAQSKGMRGILLKNHFDSTAGLAFLARKYAPQLHVVGGVSLNLPVGGMNPAAVEHMTQVAGGWGRVVWMPTFDAENQVRYDGDDRPYVSVARGGELLPETRAVVSAIAQHELVLATGHVSAEEALMLLREARSQGVEHMIVTHAMNSPTLMGVPEMRAAAREGAFIEFVGMSLEGEESASRVDRYANAIREIGPEFCILSSDLGRKGYALPPDGFAAFIVALRVRGFTQHEIDLMTKHNPAQLLGLP